MTYTYLTTNNAEMWLGDLNLLGDTNDETGVYTIMAQDADADLGHPVPVDVAVQRWMTDGAVASTQGHDNREIFFQVIVSAGNSGDLAAGEAALAKQLRKPTTLAWTPPEGDPYAPTTVFEIWTGHLEPIFDSVREGHLARMYGVRLTAKPWARSATVSTIPAAPTTPSPTVTTIDNCTSTTGWLGYPNAATTSGGALHESLVTIGGSTVPPTHYQLRFTRNNGAVSMVGTPYILIDSTTTGGVGDLLVVADGTVLVKAGAQGNLSWWKMPTGVTSFTVLTINAQIDSGGPPTTLTFNLNDVSKTDGFPAPGSRKQLSRIFEVGGSVPTSGSIKLASPSATALGTCLVYTYPDDGSGYSPPMRQYRTSGNTVTSDATMVSGSREALVTAGVPGSQIVYTVPAGNLPEGTYVVVTRCSSTVAGNLTLGLTANISGSTTFQTITPVTIPLSGGGTALWTTLGFIHLPATAQPAGSQLATIITLTPGGAGTNTLDELYLLNRTRGDISLINASTATRLWIDAPDADPVLNRPAIYLGTLDDRSDAFGAPAAQITSMGDHDLDPDGTLLFTVTDNVADAAASATAYRRWHTHAGA